MNYCKVRDCRFAFGHVTSGHRCGNCHGFGHGVVECSDSNQKQQLAENYGADKLPENMYCTVPLCRYPWSHINRAHHCSICGGNHSSIDCEQSSESSPSDENDAAPPVGITCATVTGSTVGGTVKCPICRVDNQIPSNQAQVYGTTEQCVVCMNEHANVFLPQCGHVCVCINCVNKL
jgi:hypothetical protein